MQLLVLMIAICRSWIYLLASACMRSMCSREVLFLYIIEKNLSPYSVTLLDGYPFNGRYLCYEGQLHFECLDHISIDSIGAILMDTNSAQVERTTKCVNIQQRMCGYHSQVITQYRVVPPQTVHFQFNQKLERARALKSTYPVHTLHLHAGAIIMQLRHMLVMTITYTYEAS